MQQQQQQQQLHQQLNNHYQKQHQLRLNPNSILDKKGHSSNPSLS